MIPTHLLLKSILCIRKKSLGDMHTGLIGPYFYKDDVSHAIRANDMRFRSVSTNFFQLKLDDLDTNDM